MSSDLREVIREALEDPDATKVSRTVYTGPWTPAAAIVRSAQ